ncbi:serine/threonine-protein kinase [Engelhardtia mirabilis]|uniref:serine/threonine-protein kinase n=1 Tax=Engelhardtia mirabilis TaxID=2528011 RepID=UPI003AF3E54E
MNSGTRQGEGPQHPGDRGSSVAGDPLTGGASSAGRASARRPTENGGESTLHAPPPDGQDLRRAESPSVLIDGLLGLLSDEDVDELLDRHGPGALEAGAVVGDYTLLGAIGRGAMGEVWEAHQQSLGRCVALKILRRDAASARARALFEREARAMARLKQAHIVTVHDTGECEGRMWIAQELVDGRRSFADLLEERRRALEAGEEPPEGLDRQTVVFFLALARAVAYAHSHGVLHRDLKPVNVLVTETGEPKIADFGLALLRETLHGERRARGEYGMTGTPSYMSPEQVAGQVYGLDERTDIFSLGVMLYEALSLRRPFESRLPDPEDARREILEKIVTKNAEPPTDPRRRVPRKLQAICARCLEKDRDLRYPSAHALAEDLERFLDNLPLQVLPGQDAPRAGEATGEAYNPNCGHPGQYLGPFRLIRFFDRGQQGEIWEAFDTVVERPVALKIVAVEGRTQSQVDRFELEAKATARCEHPGIVRVYQSGETHGLLWIAMELVEGARTLRSVIDNEFGAGDGPQTLEAGASLTGGRRAESFRNRALFFAELAEALAAVHEHHIVHRDVKPRNVLIGNDGRPRITDFGTARALDRLGSTQTHERVGTPRYMSPEQINPDLYAIDGRSDVFSLGICLYEALSGVHPFEADSAQLIQHKVLHERPTPLSHIVTRLPADLGTICSTALEKVRDERYASMADFAADLRAFAEGRPIRARRPGPARRAARWARRHTLQVLAGTALAAAVIGLVAQRNYFVAAEARWSADFAGPTTGAAQRLVTATTDALAGGSGAPRAAAAEVCAQVERLVGQRDLLRSIGAPGDAEHLTLVLDGPARPGDGRGMIATWARLSSALESRGAGGDQSDAPLGLVAGGGERPGRFAHVLTGAVEGLDGSAEVRTRPALDFTRVVDDGGRTWWVATGNPTPTQWAALTDADPAGPRAAEVRAAMGWVDAPTAVLERVPSSDTGAVTIRGPRPALVTRP